MRNLAFCVVFIGSVILWLPNFASAQHKTPQWYKCENKVGGAWVLGRAPNACDARVYGEDRFVHNTYDPLIFDDNSPHTQERREYMQELYPFIRDAAQHYLNRRRPNASQTEINMWTRAVFAIAHQESFWSHYRAATDRRLKMMRGDFGHGHGLMQIDDRWHFVHIENGIGWDIITNLNYALDVFYAAWTQAKTASCVSSPTNYLAITRAAYSAYNGGASRICRWTNPNDAWARNDRGFLEKYQSQSWLNFVADTNKDAYIDVVCLAEGGNNCFETDNPAEIKTGDLVQVSDVGICVVDNASGFLHCTPDDRDTICLDAGVTLNTDTPFLSTRDQFADHRIKLYDRHTLCPNSLPSLIGVGEWIQVRKNINVRGVPAGGVLAVVPSGTRVQVLDFEIRGLDTKDVYYMIQYGQNRGYIYAGRLGTYSEWAISTQRPTGVFTPVASVSGQIRITSSQGINMRNTPGGSLSGYIPRGVAAEVLRRAVLSDENRVYYQVRHGNSVGYIYGGRILPDFTVRQWAEAL